MLPALAIIWESTQYLACHQHLWKSTYAPKEKFPPQLLPDVVVNN